MLQLFQSIFGTDRNHNAYPKDLIQRAIERAVDGIDPRLRAVPGYQKKMRAAVVHAIDYIVDLIDSLPEPLAINNACFSSDPELAAFFTSATRVQEILSLDPRLNHWLASENEPSQQVIMLILMELKEHNSFGMALEGDMLRREVAQTTVNFTHHQLLDPATAEQESRRLLKRRGFDHLLTLALKRVASAHSQRSDLEQERAILRRKYTSLSNCCWGFTEPDKHEAVDPQSLQQKLQKIESQLMALGAGTGLLDTHLDIAIEVLSQAEQNIWLSNRSLILDRMHVKQEQTSDEAWELDLNVLHNSTGRSLVARLVSVDYEDLPPRRDFLHEAQRYFA